MNQMQIVDVISPVGFPILMCLWFMFRTEKVIQNKELKSLKFLDASFNKFTIIPDSIGNLQNLKSLNLQRNLIEEIPQLIGNLKNLKRLKKLFRKCEWLTFYVTPAE